MLDLTQLLQSLVTGAGVGLIYGLVGIGFCVIYNASGIVNFAQGVFVMLPAEFDPKPGFLEAQVISGALAKAIEEEKVALAKLPYTEETVQAALDDFNVLQAEARTES